MLLFVGLPYEDKIDIEEMISKIKKEQGISCKCIDLPSFTGVSLENIVHYEEEVNELEKEAQDLFKRFIRKSSTLDIPEVNMYIYRHSCNWEENVYSCSLVPECLSMLSENIYRMKKLFSSKESEHVKMTKEYEAIQKKTKGSLLDLDISLIVTNDNQYEFLEEVYVLVEKENVEKFDEFIKNCTMVSNEAVEDIQNDEKYILFKVLVVRKFTDEFKKKVVSNNFIIKELKLDKENLEQTSSKIQYFMDNKDNLEHFITSHIEDLYSLLLHVKLLKLFLECLYRYGLPTTFIYLACEGDKNVIEKFKRIAENWESERMVGEEEEPAQEETEVNFAHSLVTLVDEEIN